MLKNILKLEGAQGLTKNEQKSVNGGMLSVSRGCSAYHQQFVSCAGALEGRLCYTNNCQCPGQCHSEVCIPGD